MADGVGKWSGPAFAHSAYGLMLRETIVTGRKY